MLRILKELCKCDKDIVRVDIETVGKLWIELVNILIPMRQADKDTSEEYFIRVSHE